MWRPYLKVIAKKANQAIHILDRFHIMMHFNKAIDKVRASEVRELEQKGLEPVLKKSRWLLLKRPEHLTDKQDTTLANLLRKLSSQVRQFLFEIKL
jgi:transposase